MLEVKTIPGPRGLPVLGVIPELHHDRLKIVSDMAAQYGGLVKYNVLNIPLVQVNEPDAIQHVLQDDNKNFYN